jgi:hypothetical protein
MTGKRYARNPAVGQIQKWKAAESTWKRQQRQRRGKRHTLPFGTVTGPGMVRINPPKPKEHYGER